VEGEWEERGKRQPLVDRHHTTDPRLYGRHMDPLHAAIDEFAAEGYTHIECFCPRCRMIRLRPMSWLPKISTGLTLDGLARRLRCAECGGPLLSVKPWRQADEIGKPQRRRG
jgi:phage FluMu protein Com